MKPQLRLLVILGSLLLAQLSLHAATVQVQVGEHGKRFTPATVTIQAGDTVEWVWDASGHSSTSGTPGNPNGIWDSGVQNSGFTFSQTFPTSGTFPYYCVPHGACCGMVGSVTVNSAATGGALFINANIPSGNKVWMYSRDGSGQLTAVGQFATQGSGSSGGLSSEGSVALNAAHTFLYAANAGSNEVTAFSVASTGLTFIGKVPSNGTFPNSIGIYGNLLYVLNAKGGAASNISGFTIQADGSLVAIPNSTRLLSSPQPEAAQVGFTPDGKTIIVSEKNTDNFDTYAVNGDGTTTGPTPQASSGSGPFGYAFDGNGHLVVSEITLSSASSYNVVSGVLQVVTARLNDHGKAGCWTSCTNSPSLPAQYAYVSNTNSDTISGFSVSSTGALALLETNGKTAILTRGAFPLDSVVSSDNQYYYVLEQKLPGIGAFQIQSDGTLVAIQTVNGTPKSSYGMTGY